MVTDWASWQEQEWREHVKRLEDLKRATRPPQDRDYHVEVRMGSGYHMIDSDMCITWLRADTGISEIITKLTELMPRLARRKYTWVCMYEAGAPQRGPWYLPIECVTNIWLYPQSTGTPHTEGPYR